MPLLALAGSYLLAAKRKHLRSGAASQHRRGSKQVEGREQAASAELASTPGRP